MLRLAWYTADSIRRFDSKTNRTADSIRTKKTIRRSLHVTYVALEIVDVMIIIIKVHSTFYFFTPARLCLALCVTFVTCSCCRTSSTATNWRCSQFIMADSLRSPGPGRSPSSHAVGETWRRQRDTPSGVVMRRVLSRNKQLLHLFTGLGSD